MHEGGEFQVETKLFAEVAQPEPVTTRATALTVGETALTLCIVIAELFCID